MVCLPGMERFWWECGKNERHFFLNIPAVHNKQLEGSKRAKSNGGRSQGAGLPKPLDVFLTVLHLKGFPGFPLFGATCVVKTFLNLKQTNSPELGQFIDVDGGAGPHHEVQRKERLQWSDGVAWIICTFGHTCCHHVGSDIGWWPPPSIPPNLQGEFETANP